MTTQNRVAIVYCEGFFNTANGKTAHGLVRFTERYRILAVIDSRYHGKNSGTILDGRPNTIPIIKSLDSCLVLAKSKGITVSDFIVGLATDGGKLPQAAIGDIKNALRSGLNVINGLHDFITDNKELVKLAKKNHCQLLDIRKPASRKQLLFFSGKIEQVDCLKIAVLGTDSAVGKRTTAWMLVHAYRAEGYRSELIGTGQTAWLQGAKYSIILDSIVNDFVSGEIENAVYQAWENEKPDVIVLEGQGSLMNPAYPGGFELLAAGRPDFVVLQHAPRRIDYDGFPGYSIHPLNQQIKAIEIISGKKVKAISINHESMDKDDIRGECRKIRRETGLPAFDVLEHGAGELMKLLLPTIKK